jgi:hypothetical protein
MANQKMINQKEMQNSEKSERSIFAQLHLNTFLAMRRNSSLENYLDPKTVRPNSGTMENSFMSELLIIIYHS